MKFGRDVRVLLLMKFYNFNDLTIFNLSNILVHDQISKLSQQPQLFVFSAN